MAAVSVLAVIALAGTTFGGGWARAVSAAPEEVQAAEGVPARTYVFSFGLEHAYSATPARPTATEQQVRHD